MSHPESENMDHYNDPIRKGEKRSAIDLKQDILADLFYLQRRNILNDSCASLTADECVKKEMSYLDPIREDFELLKLMYPEDKDVPIMEMQLDDAERAIHNSVEGQKMVFGENIIDIMAHKEVAGKKGAKIAPPHF